MHCSRQSGLFVFITYTLYHIIIVGGQPQVAGLQQDVELRMSCSLVIV